MRTWMDTIPVTSVFLMLLACVLTLSACSPPSFLPKETPLTVVGTLGGPLQTELVEARIVLSRGKHMVDLVVPLQQNEFKATVSMPIGQWELTVLLLDAEGIVHFQNTPQTIQIAIDQPNVVDLVLRPADSEVHVSIDLEHYIFREEALRARIYFSDEMYEVIRANGQEPFETTLFLAPGSYEFKIELFTESFRVGDRLGLGAWEIVQIPANEQISIVWNPVTEVVEISGRIETLLPAPTNVVCETVEQGVRISWDPPHSEEVVGYFIYAQTSPLERFELLSPVPWELTSFLYTHDPENEPPTDIRFAVAAVGKSGYAGYYSPAQIWLRP